MVSPAGETLLNQFCYGLSVGCHASNYTVGISEPARSKPIPTFLFIETIGFRITDDLSRVSVTNHQKLNILAAKQQLC